MDDNAGSRRHEEAYRMSEEKPSSLCYVDSTVLTDKEKISGGERKVLQQAGESLAAASSFGRIMRVLLEHCEKLFSCDRICLAFVEDDRQRLVAHSVRARYGPILLDCGYADEWSGSSLHEVIVGGRTRIIYDLRAYHTEHPNSRSTSLLVREGINSSMACPLTIGGRHAGVVFYSSRQPGAYSTREVALHAYLAADIIQAIEKAYVREEVSVAKKAYLEMLDFVGRELKNPLASIIMDGSTLADGYLGRLNEEQRNRIEQIIVKADFLLGLVRDYHNLARIEAGELHIDSKGVIDFTESVVFPVMEEIKEVIAERDMELDLDMPDSGVEAECDADLMRIVLANLLDNAVAYGRAGGNIVLHASRTTSNLVVSVWNEGQGFSEKDQSRLFRKFERLQTPHHAGHRRGTGVGLYTCWRIINLHGGKIWAKSEPGVWAEFSFKIPQPLTRHGVGD